MKGLELGSTFTWNLALKDRFNENIVYYDVDRILCTVLVGNKGYSSIKAAMNTNGSDGTVRVSTANMNCSLIMADFITDPTKPDFSVYESTGNCAFFVLNNVNHSTITLENTHADQFTFIAQKILDALIVNDLEFIDYCNNSFMESDRVMENCAHIKHKHGYENIVFHVSDTNYADVKDYFIEFYEDDDSDKVSELFHGDIIDTTHLFSDDNSYRSMLIDCTMLYNNINNIDSPIKISLYANPDISEYNNNVGYATNSENDIGGLLIDRNRINEVFKQNQTLLFNVVIIRIQKDKVFKFSNL